MLVDCLIEWEDGGIVEPHKHSLLRAPTRHYVLQQNNNRVKDVRKKISWMHDRKSSKSWLRIRIHLIRIRI
jgi:hypothetical protein